MENSWLSFWGFAIISVLAVFVIVVLFLILLAMPQSKLRGITLEIFGGILSSISAIGILATLLSPIIGDEILILPFAIVGTMGIVSVIQGRKTMLGFKIPIAKDTAVEINFAVDEKRLNPELKD